MKKTKSFKIGEYATGGIIKVEKDQHFVTIQALDYSTKKAVTPKVNLIISDHWSINSVLNELTTCYFSDQILQYIKK